MTYLPPKYPIYIPSKGRADACLTARCLAGDGVPFRMVVEPQERAVYEAVVGAANVLVLPFSDLGSVIPARNWIKEHAAAEGYERHWQLDDNIKQAYRLYRGERLYCHIGVALRVAEDFTDRYENIAVSGLTYCMFQGRMADKQPPFYLNHHVYSCSLILNSLPNKWRGRYNEDSDFCLQVLADGWCTVLINAFSVDKITTMVMKGGNTDALYQGDGRLKMARSLERVWPGVVSTYRRFQRPQHLVKENWRRFNIPLKLKPGITLDSFQGDNEYGMKLIKKQPIKSDKLRKLIGDRVDTDNE